MVVKGALLVLCLILCAYEIQSQTSQLALNCPSVSTTVQYSGFNVDVVIACQMLLRSSASGQARGSVCSVDSFLCFPTTCSFNYTSNVSHNVACSFTIPANSPMETFDIMISTYDSFADMGTFDLVARQQPPCAAGYGTYTDAYCQLCPKGTYSNNGTNCVVCPPGTLGLSAGLSSCTPCAPGYYGGGGSSACTIAPTGFYSPGGVFRSTACEPGFYTASSGASTCTPCPLGYYTSCGATTFCTKCPVGKIAAVLGTAVCTACPPGTYASATGASACTPCPAGKYSTTLAATSSSSCLSCPSGQNLLSGCSHSSYCCV